MGVATCVLASCYWLLGTLEIPNLEDAANRVGRVDNTTGRLEFALVKLQPPFCSILIAKENQFVSGRGYLAPPLIVSSLATRNTVGA